MGAERSVSASLRAWQARQKLRRLKATVVGKTRASSSKTQRPLPAALISTTLSRGPDSAWASARRESVRDLRRAGARSPEPAAGSASAKACSNKVFISSLTLPPLAEERTRTRQQPLHRFFRLAAQL